MSRRLFGTIRKLPSGRYQARHVDASGRRHRAPNTFATKADAGRWLADVEAAIARGTWIDPDAGRVLLADYAQGWIDSRPGLRPRTRELYQSLLDLHLAPALGDVALVFTGAKGAPSRRSNWSVKWRAACRHVGVEGLRFHDLRHTCNTLRAATGASTRELMHRMAHSSASAALRYQHATKKRDAVIAAALDRLIWISKPDVISSSELDS